jgi:hypothetical protein
LHQPLNRISDLVWRWIWCVEHSLGAFHDTRYFCERDDDANSIRRRRLLCGSLQGHVSHSARKFLRGIGAQYKRELRRNLIFPESIEPIWQSLGRCAHALAILDRGFTIVVSAFSMASLIPRENWRATSWLQSNVVDNPALVPTWICTQI